MVRNSRRSLNESNYSQDISQDFSRDDSVDINSRDFPYVQRAKNHTLQVDSNDWKKMVNLPSPEEFWSKKDKQLVWKYDDILDYIESLVLTVDDVRELPMEVLKLFEVTQCILEIKDIDVENVELDLQDAEAENETLKKEISALKIEVQNLKKDDTQNNRKEKIREREIEDKNVEITEWKKRCFDKDVVISKLTSDIDEEKRKLRESEVNCVKIEHNNRLLQEEVSALTIISEKMRGRNVEDDQAIQELEDNVDQLEEERDNLKIELEETMDKVLELEKQLDLSKKIEAELRDTLQKSRFEIETRIKDAEDRQNEIDNLKKKNHKLEKQHNNNIEELKKMNETKLQTLKTEIISLKKDIDSKEDTIIEYTQKLTQLQTNPFKASSYKAVDQTVTSSFESDTVVYDQSHIIRELKQEIASLKEQLNNQNLYSIEISKDHSILRDSVNDKSLDSEHLKRLEEEKSIYLDKIIQLEQTLANVESELIWSKQKIKSYEDGQSGLDIAKKEIQYQKEQLYQRESTIEKYKRMLNMFLNNLEDLKIELINIYKKYNHPSKDQIDVNNMKENVVGDIVENLLHDKLRKMKELETEVDTLNKELQERKKLYPYSIDDYNNMKLFLEEQISMLKKSESVLQEEKAILQQKYDKIYQKSSSDDTIKYNQSNNDYEALQKKLQLAESEIKNLREKIISFGKSNSEKSAVETLEEELFKKRMYEVTLLDKIESLEKSNNQMMKEINQIKQNNLNNLDKSTINATDSISEIEFLRQRLRDAEEHFQKILEENSAPPSLELKKKLIETQNEVNSMKRKFEDVNQTLEISKKQNILLKEQISNLSEKLTGSINFGKSISSKDNSNEIKLEFEKRNRELQMQLDNAYDEIESLREYAKQLKEKEKAQKSREVEWNEIQSRLEYYEEILKHDQEAEKNQSQNTVKKIVAGYNAVISQKDRAIEKYISELESLRIEIIRMKKYHEDELEEYKKMLKSNDLKILHEMQENIKAIENQVDLTEIQIPGMALEDVEEIMANKNREIDQLSEENAMLKNRIDELETDQEDQYTNFQKMKKQLETEIESQDSEIQSLKFQIADLQSKKQEISIISTQTPKKNIKYDSISDLESNLSKLQMNTLKEELQSEVKKNSHLRGNVETLSRNLLDVQRALRKKQKFEAKQKELEQMKIAEKNIPEQKIDVNELKNEISRLKLALEKKEKVISSLQEKYLESQREISAKESVLSRMNEKIQRQQRTQNRLQKDIESYKKDDVSNDITQEYSEMEKKLKILQRNPQKKDNFDQILQQKDRDIEEQKKIVIQTEETLLKSEKNHQKENQKLIKKISSLEEENRNLEIQIESTNNQLKSVKAKAKQDQESYEKELKDIKQKLNKEIHSQKIKIESPKVDKSPQNDENDKQLKMLKQDLLQQKEKYENTIHTLNTDLQHIKNLSKEKDIKLQQLQSQIDSFYNSNSNQFSNDALSKIDELRRNINDYYNLKDEIIKSKLKSQQEKEFFELQISQIKMQKPQSAENEVDFNSQLLEKQKEAVGLRFENEELKQKLNLLNQKLKDLEILQAIQMEIGSKTPDLNVSKVMSTNPEDKTRSEDLEKVIEAMKIVITKVQDENEKLKKNATTNRDYMDLVNKLKSTKSKLEVKAKENEKLQKDLEILEETREKLTKTLEQNVQLTKKMKKEKETTSKYKKDCETIEIEKQKLEAELKKNKDFMTHAHNSALERQKSLHNQKLAELTEQKQSYKLKNDQLRNRIKELEKNDEKNKTLISELENKFELEKDVLKQKIEEFESKIKEISKEKTNEPNINRLQVNEETKKLELYKAQLEDLKIQNSKLKAKIDNTNNKLFKKEELEKKIQELEKQRDQLIQENREQKEELDQFDESFFEELEDLKYKYMESRRLNDDYRSQLEDLGIRVDPPEK